MPIVRWWRHPACLALLLTLANVPKPVAVDDTVYLAFARQIAVHPTDPYGHAVFWYREPQPAMEILCPPLVPYWLGLGIATFGEVVPLLKLWLIPFALILAYALRALLRRFAPHSGEDWLPAFVLGPGVVPFFNLMLDVPALALHMAAVAVFVAARPTWRNAAFAGLLAGAAMQAKYSSLVLPAVLLAWGLVSGRRWSALASASLAVGGFALVEAAIAARYGDSHFLHHLRAAQGGKLEDKFSFLLPLLSYLGLTAGWIGFAAWQRLGLPGRWVNVAGGLAAIGFLAVVALPGRHTALVSSRVEGVPNLTFP